MRIRPTRGPKNLTNLRFVPIYQLATVIRLELPNGKPGFSGTGLAKTITQHRLIFTKVDTMKIMFGLIATITLSVGAFAMPNTDSDASLELTNVALQDEAAPVEDAVQDAVPPTPEEPPAPAEAPAPVEQPAATETPAEPPAPMEAPAPVEAPAAVEETAAEPAAAADEMPVQEMSIIETPSVMSEGVIVAQPMMIDQPIISDCCPTCCCSSCCCPPPAPSPTTFCLVDPCGCSHQACINVPACCAGQQPTVCWRSGFLRRQIATVTWDCCGHSVKVVITCRGKVRVRG
jgi:hypothetical protein